MRRAGIPLAAWTWLLGVLSLAIGCDDGDAETDPGAASGGAAAQSQRNSRYCEVIPLYQEAGALHAHVWNTRPFNDCPQAAWDALDATDIGAELGAAYVLMNGPRYFLMDAADMVAPDDPPTHTFGSLQMARFATFDLDPATVTQQAYIERAIARDTQFWFWAGVEIYELLAPDGAAYVMQSYALIVDPSLSLADLPSLGARLQLPAGWTYRARVLSETLEVNSTGGEAIVLQDELQNTYQRYLAP